MPQTDAEPRDGEIETAKPTWFSRRVLLVAVAVAVVLFVASAVAVVEARRNADDQANLAARQAEVEQRGAQVMPFDQNLTTHHFTKTDNGGVQTVTANDPSDTTQVTLVQDHLQHERDLFATGDFSDPMAIHGHQMPGIADLQHGASTGAVTVAYVALPDGGQLTYTAQTPALVNALHTWFDAQLMDHGSHAMS